ncbi:HAMP domain-containing histidine kinase [Nocardia puris]|uniref:histidine kinase n=1 Tax=Nocardia puris TaxID=208602 RepID=A0A366D397_9NOCA|nr:HAMP domain-containing sensor histidine kinase [Nocardia puris]MBF6214807.1 HAMP domain-containing histidine kinase [Nocardia puris]MBF6364184.1 HAMP domain-containing histidine kinase [Nocardia puris]MBF6459113.1 HAMP domain-containing histidine kinase [Nocardia puris]RBO84533.1 two-component system sensor histidine kinase MprB [Nocardia puris]
MARGSTRPHKIAPVGRPDPAEMRPPMPLTRSVSLRWRVTLLAASVVAIAVALTSIAAYAMVARALYADVDAQLRARASTMINNNFESMGFQSIILAGLFSNDVGVALIFADHKPYIPPQHTDPPLGEEELAVADGTLPSSLRTVRNQRVLAVRTNSGATLVISQRLEPTREVLDRLAWLLFVVGGCGVVLAAAAGTAVGRTGLRPIARLTAATERVARTDDLTPIPVTGDDELARLTESFNTMLRALAESRDRQRRLVADAGHELRTPLTSLRTNMELLIASGRPGAPRIPEEDMAELRADVVAQIEELSTLVGDLVDLAREDAPETVYDRIDLGEVTERALERARRRRGSVEFVAELRPWFVYGHEAGLERAVLNVLDNAAKWSSPGTTVRVTMREAGRGLLELAVDDAGPGIPAAERELVFERFYRTTASRSMPGSGLGLAIVKQVVTKHGGTISIDTSERGGALIRIVLPGEGDGASAAQLSEN